MNQTENNLTMLRPLSEWEQGCQSPSIFLSGFPYDQGTRRNGGRVGGAIASTKFREGLQLFSKPIQTEIIYDCGDIPKQLELEQAHEALLLRNRELFRLSNQNTVIFSVGGSNDQSYLNVKALMERYPKDKIAVINLDSHFDVRPLNEGKAHSGSPFRQMLEDPLFESNGSTLIEFAVKGSTCSKAHYDYLKEKKAEVYWLEKHIRQVEIKQPHLYRTQAAQLFYELITGLEADVEHIFVSFDVDCISSKWMSGVSAPSVAGGLTSQEAIEIMAIAGRSKKVKLVDCSEFNPAVESFFSCKLLLQMFFSLVNGYTLRKKESLEPEQKEQIS